MGTNFNDLWNDSSFISEEQRNKIDFEVALIGKLEKMNVTPQLNTLIKVLKPLGYRLDIVPCD